MRHIIKKQIIELNVGKSLDHFNVQQKISGHYFRYFIPMLEKEFDKVSPEGSVLSIERLEIDLGEIFGEHLLMNDLNEEILKLVEQKISFTVSELVFSSKQQNVIPAGENSFRQWLEYMRRGYLPWNYTADDRWYTNVLETLATDYNCAAELSREILKNRDSLLRIIRQHTPEFLTVLAETLTAQNQSSLLQLFAEIKAFIKETAAKNPKFINTEQYRSTIAITQDASNEELWKQVFLVSAQREKKTALELAAVILKKIIPNEIISEISISQLSGGIKLIEPVIIQIQNEFKLTGRLSSDIPNTQTSQSAGQNKNAYNTDESIKKLPHDDENISSGKPKLSSEESEEQKKDILSDEVSSPEELITAQVYVKEIIPPELTEDETVIQGPLTQDIAKDGIFVRYAGLVLLHPFLSSLFKHTGLVSGRNFVNEASHLKAVFLLHYTATGEITAEEHELVVPKLLCGYEIKKPVRNVLPADDELFETDNMLRAAIAQWKILKNTTPDGLREGFLRRNGKIYTKNDNIYIQVEKNAVDILLDNLPWGLSMIKLPWLNEIIRVEWR